MEGEDEKTRWGKNKQRGRKTEFFREAVARFQPEDLILEILLSCQNFGAKISAPEGQD